MMSPFSDLPLRRKLIVIGAITILVALVLNNAIALFSTFGSTRRTISADVQAQSEIMADNLWAPLAFDARSEAAATLLALQSKVSIDLGCLYGSNGALFAEYSRTPSRLRCPLSPPAEAERALSGASVLTAVTEKDRRVGTLYLHGNYDELWARLRSQGNAAMVSLLVSAVIALVLMLRLHRTITDPLLSLAAVAADVTRRGDYALRAARMSGDETGALVDAFNNMLAHVQHRDSELSQANLELSREILERQRVENERIELLRREREANRLKDEFLAALSHELRTPLNAILGWTQILKSTGGIDDKSRRGLASIERNAHAQTRMVEDLLDISRIVSGKFHMKTDVIDLNGVVDGAVEVVRPLAEARNIAVRREHAGQQLFVVGDQDRLQQVVWNILSNAVKFTPAGGSVTVRTGCDDHQCFVEIQDTGAGIDPEFLPHVFDRFRQADGTMAREHGGLGLGLAIAHEIVELHGGTVAAESGGRGLGATFTIRLPTVNPPAPGPRDETARGAPTLAALRVLVVDDDPDARDIATAGLTAAGASVDAAPSARAALALLGAQRYSAIVCDIGMPETDGFAFLKALRESPSSGGSATPAIAVTAYASNDDITRVEASGFFAHLAKPYAIEALVAVVGKAVASAESA